MAVETTNLTQSVILTCNELGMAIDLLVWAYLDMIWMVNDVRPVREVTWSELPVVCSLPHCSQLTSSLCSPLCFSRSLHQSSNITLSERNLKDPSSISPAPASRSLAPQYSKQALYFLCCILWSHASLQSKDFDRLQRGIHVELGRQGDERGASEEVDPWILKVLHHFLDFTPESLGPSWEYERRFFTDTYNRSAKLCLNTFRTSSRLLSSRGGPGFDLCGIIWWRVGYRWTLTSNERTLAPGLAKLVYWLE